MLLQFMFAPHSFATGNIGSKNAHNNRWCVKQNTKKCCTEMGKKTIRLNVFNLKKNGSFYQNGGRYQILSVSVFLKLYYCQHNSKYISNKKV